MALREGRAIRVLVRTACKIPQLHPDAGHFAWWHPRLVRVRADHLGATAHVAQAPVAHLTRRVFLCAL